MRSSSNGEISLEVTEMPEVIQANTDCLSSMQRKLKNAPHLLRKSAGGKSCSIFRVPESIIEVNREFYEPQIVSIGPYHHGKPHLRMIEEHKWRYLDILLSRTESKLEHYVDRIKQRETQARECYSQTIFLDTNKFIEMLVLDGCFIIEIFRKYEGVVECEDDDPLLMMNWIHSFFFRDFIKLENQIPFFILKELFELTYISGDTSRSNLSLANIILNFFNNTFERSDKTIESFKDPNCKHLLDFVRSSFRPAEPDASPTSANHTRSSNPSVASIIRNFFNNKFQRSDETIQSASTWNEPKNSVSSTSKLIDSISKLRHAGINLKRVQGDNFLEVRFSDGVIEMPGIIIDDVMRSFLVNCVVFEQCYERSKHSYFTTYATLLDRLIDTDKDVEYLCNRRMEENIIENFLGSDQEMATFINNLGKDVTLFFNKVHAHYHNPWHFHWASFKKTYFDSPWSFISAVAAFILLVFALAQTIFSILAYLHSL